MTSPLPDWARNPDVLEEMFHASLKNGDAKGVEASLRLLALCDVERCTVLYDGLKLRRAGLA